MRQEQHLHGLRTAAVIGHFPGIQFFPGQQPAAEPRRTRRRGCTAGGKIGHGSGMPLLTTQIRRDNNFSASAKLNRDSTMLRSTGLNRR